MAFLVERDGVEFLVNTTTEGGQVGCRIAALADGGFVVVWQDASGVSGDPDVGTKGQLFDDAGNKVGGEFLINTSTAGNQIIPAVAGLPGGGFVVTWGDLGTAGADTDGSVKARVFAANGTALGGEFLVNTTTSGTQGGPSISVLADGKFVIAWQDPSGVGGDASGLGVKAQLFDASGTKVGGEILANTTTTGSQYFAQTAALAGGGFAVSWASAPGYAMVQVFDSAGAKLGAEQSVVVGTPGQVRPPRIDAVGTGFLVTWGELAFSGDPLDIEIKAQRFDATGAKIGPVFALTSPTEGEQIPADIRGLPDGGFVAIWNSAPDGTNNDVFAQVFDAGGQMVGAEFVVNATTAGNQYASAVELLASGDLAVAWTDGTVPATEVQVQLLAPSTTGASDIILSTQTVSETAVENLQVATISAAGGALNATYTYELVFDTTGGAFAIDGDRLIVVDNGLLDFETAPIILVDVRAIDNNGNAFEEILSINVANAAIEERFAAGEVFSAQGSDQPYDTVSSVTPLASGGFLVARQVIASGIMGARGQIFDADGQAVGSDILFDLPLISNYEFPIAALAGGGFVTAFGATPDGGFSAPVKVQRFDAAGNEVGSEEILDGGEGGYPEPSITSLAGGGFVVTWSKYATPLGSPVTADIHGQLFDASGAKLESEFVVNTGLDGTQHGVRSAALAGGGFVVAWREYDPAVVDDGGSIEAQMFDAAGDTVGGELTILADATDADGTVGLAALASGGFALVWRHNIDDANDVYALAVQIVGADGVNIGGPLLSYTGGIDGDFDPSVAALPDGGFVVTWTGQDPAVTDGPELLWGQFFDASGALVGTRFLVDDSAAGVEESPEVGVTASGDVVFAWSLLLQDAAQVYTSDAYARILRPITEGTSDKDFFDLDEPGDVNVSGLGGNDGFYFGAEFTAADKVDGDAGTNDQIGLEGDYSGANALTLGPYTITDVEVLAVLPGFDYDITTVDANVPFERTLLVFAGNLGPDDSFTFDGSAETDGRFQVFGGQGADVIITGAEIDIIAFGPGRFDPTVDRVDGFSGPSDQLTLDGHYTVRLDGTAIRNIDYVLLLEGDPGDLSTYNLTLDETLIGSGGTITIGGGFVLTELVIDASDDTDGTARLFGGTVDDTLTGGGGNDLLQGNSGADLLTGGGGADQFYYDWLFEAAAATPDLITDFTTGDTIFLAGIDGDSATFGHQSLHFGATPGHTGDVILTFNAGSNETSISIHVDGDGVADGLILLSGNHLGLGASDIIL